MKREPSAARARAYRLLEAMPAAGAGRALRIALAVLIVANVVAVILESIESLGDAWAGAFLAFDWFSVAVFTVEYGLRIWACVENPRYAGPRGRLRFALSPLALVDLLAILPFYLGGLIRLDTRVLRSLRLLRIFKLSRHSASMDLLLTVIRQETASIFSAMFIMVIVIVFAASGMYAIEREANPEAFDSIPKAMWWAAVTLTTVGYGDVVPVTVLGKMFGLLITIGGVGMVALPAGILASGFSLELQRRREVFREQLREALVDGSVSRPESARLEARRDELGLSEEEARRLLQEASEESADRLAACPHCGADLHGSH